MEKDSQAADISAELFPEPSPEQLELLDILWDHLLRTWNDPNGGPAWPVWNYVDVTFSRSHPHGPTAEEILQSLPRLARSSGRGGSYSALWWNEPSQPWPLPASKVGLSILGFHLLRQKRNSGRVADGLVRTIASIAGAQEKQEPSPYLVPIIQKPLRNFLGSEFSATMDHPFEVSESMIKEVLEREYAALNLQTTSGSTEVNMSGPRLREFRSCADATSYIREILESIESQVSTGPRTRHLPLVQTIDYLSYVLSDDPAWKPTDRRKLVEAPNLASAAALSATANSQEEFESNLGALWNLVNKFSTPEPSVLGKDGNPERATINRLQLWLEGHLEPGPTARVRSAIQDIRAIGKIRQNSAHASTETHRDAVKAQKSLGIPVVITDWNEAWEKIKDALAHALDVIREEVQNRDRNGMGK